MDLNNSALEDKFAKHLKIEVVSVTKDKTRVKLPAQPHFLNGAGIIHGGILFTLGDYAFALAANAGDESGLAISSTINFVKAAPSGTELYATAQLVSRTNRIGTYRIDITDDKGVILAAGQSTAYFKKTEK